MKRVAALVLAVLACAVAPALAQEKKDPPPPSLDRAALVAAAREVMGAQKYCALITIAEDGRPDVRTMNPFPPEEDMSVWMATNTRSRKVAQIRRDPRVTLYYANHENAIGYVAVAGRAELTEDAAEIRKRKRDYWDQAFPGLKNLVLIRVVPERIDVLNYKAGANGSPETWRTPTIEFPAPSR